MLEKELLLKEESENLMGKVNVIRNERNIEDSSAVYYVVYENKTIAKISMRIHKPSWFKMLMGKDSQHLYWELRYVVDGYTENYRYFKMAQKRALEIAKDLI